MNLIFSATQADIGQIGAHRPSNPMLQEGL